jgi:predicted nucleic acid-binding protein
VLVDSLTGSRRSASRLLAIIQSGERLALPTLVLYEWMRGPRYSQEVAAQEALFPAERALAFGSEEALAAARLYRCVRRPRAREIDLAIAACALTHDAQLWTLNRADFTDIPGLQLFQPR